MKEKHDIPPKILGSQLARTPSGKEYFKVLVKSHIPIPTLKKKGLMGLIKRIFKN